MLKETEGFWGLHQRKPVPRSWAKRKIKFKSSNDSTKLQRKLEATIV
jgi:hypothetical protein